MKNIHFLNRIYFSIKVTGICLLLIVIGKLGVYAQDYSTYDIKELRALYSTENNPLRKIDGALDYSKMNTEFPERQSYLKCFCCPPNVVRTIAKVSGWAYGLSKNGVGIFVTASSK